MCRQEAGTRQLSRWPGVDCKERGVPGSVWVLELTARPPGRLVALSEEGPGVWSPPAPWGDAVCALGTRQGLDLSGQERHVSSETQRRSHRQTFFTDKEAEVMAGRPQPRPCPGPVPGYPPEEHLFVPRRNPQELPRTISIAPRASQIPTLLAQRNKRLAAWSPAPSWTSFFFFFF